MQTNCDSAVENVVDVSKGILIIRIFYGYKLIEDCLMKSARISSRWRYHKLMFIIY